MGLIPHQLGLTKAQMMKLMKGLPIQISHPQMGSGAGDVVMMLHPHNAKKMLSSYKKGKGVRMCMSPEEVHHTLQHGRGFMDYAKKAMKFVGNVADKALENPAVRTVAKKGARYGSDIIGTAVGTYMGNPVAGAMIGDAVGRAAETAIDRRSVSAGANSLKGSASKKGKQLAMDAVERQVSKLPDEYKPLAQSALHSAMNQMKTEKDGNLGYGMKRPRGRPRKSMDMGVGLYGGGTPIEDQQFSLSDVARTAKKIFGNGMSKRPAKGSPEMKEYMAKIRGMKKDKGKGLYGGGFLDDLQSAFDPNKNGVADAFRPETVKRRGKKIGQYVIPAAGSAIGGVAGSYIGGPMGGVAGSAAGKYAGDEAVKQMGTGRKRGRPRKGTGVSASLSKPFKQALALNKMTYGLSLNNSTGANDPVSKFKTDPRVKPSSTEMTLSPYQSMSSPAMNPFVPTTYQQQGGESKGYGEGTPFSNIYGRGVRRRRKGMGLGMGLYGGGTPIEDQQFSLSDIARTGRRLFG